MEASELGKLHRAQIAAAWWVLEARSAAEEHPNMPRYLIPLRPVGLTIGSV